MVDANSEIVSKAELNEMRGCKRKLQEAESKMQKDQQKIKKLKADREPAVGVRQTDVLLLIMAWIHGVRRMV